MEYHSNAGNLFKKYSNLSGGRKNRPEETPEDRASDLVEYTQRYKAEPPPPPKERTPAQYSKVIVHIGGMQHKLAASDPEGEQNIRAVAEKADRIIGSIQEDNPGMSMTNVLTLSLVNAVDQLNRSEKMRLERDTRIEELMVNIESVKDDYLKQREINWELKKEALRLKDLVRAQDEDEAAVFSEQAESRLPLEDLLIRSEAEEPDERP
jgi:cell division protein ZapA (FtsZ GTPase activity inhibitor)